MDGKISVNPSVICSCNIAISHIGNRSFPASKRFGPSDKNRMSPTRFVGLKWINTPRKYLQWTDKERRQDAVVDGFREHGNPRSSHSSRGRAAESCITSRFVNEKGRSGVVGDGSSWRDPGVKVVEFIDYGLNPRSGVYARTFRPVGVLTG